MARWLSTSPPVIKFIEEDHRCQSAIKTATASYTDGTGLASLAGVEGLPVARDPLLLFVRNAGGRGSQPYRTGPARVIMRDGIPSAPSVPKPGGIKPTTPTPMDSFLVRRI
jgi:hypothetical protein